MTATLASFARRRIKPLALLLLAPAFFIGLLFIVLSVVDVDRYERLIREDGPIESGSALLWFVAALVSLTALVVLYRRRATHVDRVTYFVYAAAILFFIVAGGEEISWGQRFFGFQPPDEVLALNKQGEANVHNIGSISVYANTFFLFTLGVFLLLPIFVKKNPRVRDYMLRHGLPLVDRRATSVYVVVLAVWVFVGIRFGTLGFHPFSIWDHYTQLDDEVFELGAAYAFAALGICDLARRISEARVAPLEAARREPRLRTHAQRQRPPDESRAPRAVGSETVRP
jgi:hypothetical protein